MWRTTSGVIRHPPQVRPANFSDGISFFSLTNTGVHRTRVRLNEASSVLNPQGIFETTSVAFLELDCSGALKVLSLPQDHYLLATLSLCHHSPVLTPKSSVRLRDTSSDFVAFQNRSVCIRLIFCCRREESEETCFLSTMSCGTRHEHVLFKKRDVVSRTTSRRGF